MKKYCVNIERLEKDKRWGAGLEEREDREPALTGFRTTRPRGRGKESLKLCVQAKH